MLYADGEVGDFGITFHDLFESAAKGTVNEFAKDLLPNINLCFELTSLKNRIVTVYKETGLHLLMGRDKSSFKELNRTELDILASKLNVKMPKSYAFDSIEDIVKMSTELPQLDEGYVVVDYTNIEVDGLSLPRIKVKNPAYVAIAHLKDSSCSSRRRLLELVIKNEGDEFLSHFPEFTDEYNDLKEIYQEFSGKVKAEWEGLQPEAMQVLAGNLGRKEFAAKACKTTMPAAMFVLLDGKISSIDDYFFNIPSKKWMTILKIKDKENTTDE